MADSNLTGLIHPTIHGLQAEHLPLSKPKHQSPLLNEVKIKMELEKLQLEKKTAAAVAEAETLKAAANKWNERISPSNSRFDLAPADLSPHMIRYLAEQTSQHAESITGTQPLRNQEINQERQTR